MAQVFTALNWRASDRTWDMNAKTRQVVASGVLEGTGRLKQDVSGSGTVQVTPLTVITSQGLIVWTEEVHNLIIPSDGVFYVLVFCKRGRTSSANPEIVIAPEATASYYITGGNAEYTAVLGKFEMGAGVASNWDVSERDSIAVQSHYRIKGVFKSGLPDLSASDPFDATNARTNNLGELVYPSDIKDGDVCLVIDGTKAYIHIADVTNNTYRIFSAAGSTKDILQIGVGASAIYLDAVTGKITVGSSGTSIESNGAYYGKYLGSALKPFSSAILNTYIGNYIRPLTTSALLFGSGAPEAFAPRVTKVANLGLSTKEWKEAHITTTYTHDVKRNGSSGNGSIGDLDNYFQSGYFITTFTNYVRRLFGTGPIVFYNGIIPNISGNSDIGSTSMPWGTLYANDIQSPSYPYPRGYIDGLQMSRSTGVNYKVLIANGACRDSSNTTNILVVPPSLGKTLEIPWESGNDKAGIPSATGLAASTWYHYFVIKHTNGTVDAGYDTSLTAANLLAASGYTYYRRIGSVYCESVSASPDYGTVTDFEQIGDTIIWKEPILISGGALPPLVGVPTAQKISQAPLGINSTLIMSSDIAGTSGSMFIWDGIIGVISDTTAAKKLTLGETVTSNYEVITDTHSQIYLQKSSNNVTGFTLNMQGYKDIRGKA